MAKAVVLKGDLVRAIGKAQRTSSYRADRILNAVLDTVEAALRRGRTVTVTGFGTFSVRRRRARRTVSIASRRAVVIPPHKVVHFTPSPSLNRAIR
ncbi:MAG: HU family DNA-binding protein [Armatimonadetes bacterium]|nr:HU family DNA-binding protein [Armatimonadota bacterium]